MTDTNWAEEQGAIAALLQANRERRQAAAAELNGARGELRGLLLRGQAVAMDVAEMAGQARVSRDTAHRILKEAGTMSWRQKQAWAAEVMELVPRGDFEQNEFRMFLQTYLYKALGSKPEDVPRSIEGVLARATETMRTIGGKPDFEPVVDSERLRSFHWPTEPFEIIQRGTGASAKFQIRLGALDVGPWRSTAEDVARDLKASGGNRPAFIDRTGPECVASDGRRVGWDILRDI
jgi:hypothetical protein